MTSELSALRARVAELEAIVKAPETKPFVRAPHRPLNPLNVGALPANALNEMVRAVPSSVVADLVNDFRRGPSRPSSLTAQQNRAVPEQNPRGSGWVAEIPIGPPAGVELCDRLIDTQDILDRVELEQQLGNARSFKGGPE